MKKVVVLTLFGLLLCYNGSAQKSVVVLENVWANELNNFTPKDFFNKFYLVLKEKLGVKQVVEDLAAVKAETRDTTWSARIKQRIKAKNIRNDSAYFVTISSDLRLPVINIGRLFFKNPSRSSKFIFTIHVFDAAANEILTDTIVSRGCVVKSVEENKGNRYFYTDYDSFLHDMQCHLEVIKRSLQQIALPKRRIYLNG